jgi:hypothetical protein
MSGHYSQRIHAWQLLHAPGACGLIVLDGNCSYYVGAGPGYKRYSPINTALYGSLIKIDYSYSSSYRSGDIP